MLNKRGSRRSKRTWDDSDSWNIEEEEKLKLKKITEK